MNSDKCGTRISLFVFKTTIGSMLSRYLCGGGGQGDIIAFPMDPRLRNKKKIIARSKRHVPKRDLVSTAIVASPLNSSTSQDRPSVASYSHSISMRVLQLRVLAASETGSASSGSLG